MYADTEQLMFPYFQNLSSDFCDPNKFITCSDNLIEVSDYDLGGEGDLFEAPESIINQPLDPMTTSISPELKLTDIETLKTGESLNLNDVFYECKTLIGNGTETSPLSEIVSFSFPVDPIPKSMSSDNLNSVDHWIQGGEIDMGGMRRAFSEGDMKTLSDCSRGLNYHPIDQLPPVPVVSEDRMQKLSRYRSKKTRRNFGRKIKYACRKALADSQPRIRGRFAKTDELDILRK